MLEELRIQGLGVIDDAVLTLGPGLTVVTGETGAGKTMVVTGLLLLFGARADTARVRTGAAQAVVDGQLQVADAATAQRVRDAGGDLDDDTSLVVRRTISAAGRSRAFVGGAAAPVSVLSELAERLVSVHGQADQLRLTHRGEQLAVIDRYGEIDTGPYANAYRDWRAAEDALAERTVRTGQMQREADLLSHGIDEISAVAPQPAEDDELAALASKLAHADALRRAARGSHDALAGDAEDPTSEAPNARSLLATASRLLEHEHGADPQLDGLASRLGEIDALVADVASELRDYAERLEADPQRLEQIEQRRAQLRALVRKYGDEAANISGVMQWAQRATERLADLDTSDEAIATLTAQRDAAAAQLATLAGELSAARRAAAARLQAAVDAELASLAMPGARLQVTTRPRAVGQHLQALTVGPDGADDVDLGLQPHPTSPVVPIARGASGGELSRVMLAIEVSLAGTDPVPTMVFDEVDAGVGGRAAVEVGRRLASLARSHQVIVVTHLAQVAAFADRHIVVDRAGPGADEVGVTASDVRLVSGPERVVELARMLAGTDSATALRHAQELLDDASRWAAGGSAAPRRDRLGAAATKVAKTPA